MKRLTGYAIGLVLACAACQSQDAPGGAVGGAGSSATAGQGGTGADVDAGSEPTAGAGGNGVVGAGSSPIDLYVPDAGTVWHRDPPDGSVMMLDDQPDPALVPTVSTIAPPTSLGIASFEIVTSPEAAGIEMLSFNAVAEVSANYLYVVARNTGTNVICYPQITAIFENGAGNDLLRHYSFFTAPSYQVPGSSIVAPCMGPNEEAVAWDIQLVDTVVAPLSVIKAKVALTGEHFGGAFPHPNAPNVSASVMVDGFGTYVVGGQLSGVGQPVENLSIDVYPMDGQGFVFDHLSDIQFSTLAVGGALPFTTSFTQTSFTEFKLFVDFTLPLP